MAGHVLRSFEILRRTTTRASVSLSHHRCLPLSASPPHLQLQKDELHSLPQLTFPGRVIVIECPTYEKTYRTEILSLSKCQTLGFDVESKWPRKPKDPWVPSVVQLSSRDLCVLWQLRVVGVCDNFPDHFFPPILKSILQSRDIVKVGHASKDDATLLLKSFHVNCRNIVDTLDFVQEIPKLKMNSLQGLSAVFLGKYLAKSQKKSNWGRDCLSYAQIQYASADAWSSLEVYLAMLRFAAERGIASPPAVESAWDVIKKRKRRHLGKEILRAMEFQRERRDSCSSSVAQVDNGGIPT